MERTDNEQWKAKEVARLLALVETERRYYQEMVAAIPVGLVVLSADGSLISANRAFRLTFGLRTEDLRKKSLDQIIPSPELATRIAEVITSGIPQTGIFCTLPAAQGAIPLRIAILAMRNWDEETEIEALLMIEDLTGVEAASSASPSYQRLPAIVWEANADREFTFVSSFDEEWKSPGYFNERVHPEDREATLDWYATALKPGADISAEFRWHADGSQWRRETIRVHEDGTMTGVMSDVTERRTAEQALMQSQRAAALQGVSAKLAHELNNPLMIATGYTEELLQSLAVEDPRRGDAEAVLDATHRISALSEQLLAATRVEAPEVATVDVAAVVNSLREKILKAGGSLTVNGMESALALADEQHLEGILLTLGAARGLIAVEISSRLIAESLPGGVLTPGRYVAITLRSDSVAEPDPAILESLISSKDPKGPALARSYAIVREWQGDLRPVHDGFQLLLPAVIPSVVEEPLPVAAPPLPESRAEVEPEKPAPPPVTILVVEDEDGIRALVRKILARQGYEILEAAGGKDALDLASTYPHRIHLLLTDVMMPGMNGVELARQLLEWRPDTRVLYVSGYTDEATLHMLPEDTAFLQKPFTLGSLVHKVKDVLDAE
ncbi:MAG: response regulator [Bryobacteraceae bacterium]